MSNAEPNEPMLEGLLLEHEKLLRKISSWRAETIKYRWMNIVLFMLAKVIVPIGAMTIAMNMIGIVLGAEFLSAGISAVIAVIVTFLASLEAMLNPGAKKRLAFTLHNELDSLENRVNMARISNDVEEIKNALVQADSEMKGLLNHYSQNGY